MTVKTLKIVEELKQNNQDFEFYPTTKEMVKVIYDDVREDAESWLDIGCGLCHFKKWYNECYKEATEKYKANHKVYEDNNYSKEFYPGREPKDLYKYYVIEKSDILLNYVKDDVICLGRDFLATELMDKRVDNIFCNPPYSQYVEWTKKIILEGNMENAYLIIPERWKDNDDIQEALRIAHLTATVLGSFDFLDGERQARAKVDIVKIHTMYGSYKNDYNSRAFNSFFDTFFKFKPEKSWDDKKQEKEQVKNTLMSAEPKDRIKLLCDMYNTDFTTLNNHFMTIANLDSDILETIGVKKNNVADALKKKRENLKIKYWNLLFDQLDEVTDRLTTTTCNKLFKSFENIYRVDFRPEVIHPILLWLLQNANKYYDEQLLDFFDNMTTPDNIQNYKSNQRVFARYEYRPDTFRNKDEVTHYTLNYRIVCSTSLFYDRNACCSSYNEDTRIMRNIATIARNLGFDVDNNSIYNNGDLEAGQKAYVYDKKGKPLFEYKYYKNGNKHLKFNVELMKAINVEVARLRHWIQDKEEIEREFPAEYKGASKYFKSNFTMLANNTKLLSTLN